MKKLGIIAMLILALSSCATKHGCMKLEDMSKEFRRNNTPDATNAPEAKPFIKTTPDLLKGKDCPANKARVLPLEIQKIERALKKKA
jgi:hypothetical protein